MYNKLLNAINFIDKYHEKKYIAPSKTSSFVESLEMENVKQLAKLNLLNFYEEIFQIAKKTDLILCQNKNKSFLDGSRQKIRAYFWAQLFYKDKIDLPISISVFCEHINNSLRYRVSLELNDLRANIIDVNFFSRILEKQLSSELVYLSSKKGIKELSAPITYDFATYLIKSKEYHKILISYLIPIKADENYLFNEIIKGIELIKPYYNFVLSFYNLA